MKIKAGLSVITGFFFGLGTFFVLKFLDIENALGFSVMSGLLFYLLLFCFLVIHGKVMDKKYNEFEKVITSPIFYKTNGNFNLGYKVKNGNIYFCEAGIVCVSLDEKPYTLDEITMDNIKRLYFTDIRLVIETEDDNVFFITIPDAKRAYEALKEKEWLE